MKTALLTSANAKLEIEKLIRESIHIDVIVAWAGDSDITKMFAKYGSKLRHVVIGTHLYQTHPFALRKLKPFPVTKYMPPSGQLFHPKVYLFERGSDASAIVGSHNLTSAAFDGGNIEASLLLKGSLDEPVLCELARFAKETWLGANRISREFLTAYERQYITNRAKRAALEKFNPPKGNHRSKIDIISLSWDAFVGRVRQEPKNDLRGRLRVLEGAASIFASGRKFSEMSPEQRRALAGTYAKNESTLDDVPWGWFGSMFAQGDFKSLVKKTPHTLSQALENIPLKGSVSEAQYRKFVRTFRSAFEGKTHHGAVPTASRLLAMKRPDFFVGVNYANKEGLCKAYGVAHTTLNLNNYWERIIVPTHTSPWWNQPRPLSSAHRRVWDNRAALLDCLYYSP